MTNNKKKQQTQNDNFLNLPGRPVWYYLGIYLLATIALFHESLFSTSKLIFGTDLMAGNIFFRQFLADFFSANLNWPVWDPFIHGGMPFVDGMHGDIFYFPTLIFYILFGVFYAWGFTLALHLFLAGVFMYLFLKELGIRSKVAFLFGLIYMMAPYFVSLIYAGHNGKMFVIALTPLMFFAYHKGVNTGKFIYYILLSFTIFLITASPHMQMAYFIFLAFGVYFIATTIQRWRQEKAVPLKPAVLLICAVILGLMLSLVQFLTPYQYLKEYSMRTIRTEEGKGYEYSTSWSMHFEEATAALFFPEFCGDNIQGQKPTYWGKNPFKLNSEHISLIAVFFSILAIGLWRKRGKWFFFWTAIVTLLFTLGANTPLFRLFYLIPGISSFRAPSLISFITGFSVITLGAMGLEGFFSVKNNAPEMKKTWQVFTYITIGYTAFAMLIIILQSTFFKIWFAVFGYTPDSNKMSILKQGLDNITVGALISLVIVWAIFLLLKFYRDKKVSSNIIIVVLAGMAFLYMWHLNSKYIININPKSYYSKTPLVDYFKNKQKIEQFRVLEMPKSSRDYYLAYHGIEELSLSMLHGNQLATFEKLVQREGNFPGLLLQPVMDLLNTKYIITNQQLPPQYFPSDKFRIIQTFGATMVYENLSALPRAFPVYRYQVISDEKAILSTIRNNKFDYRSTVILEETPDNPPSVYADSLEFPVVPARVYDIENGSFKVDVDMVEDGFLFLSENYYPAWKAYENGERLASMKADFTFRAIPLKKGSHTIACKFENEAYTAAFAISKATFILLLLALIGLVVKDRFLGRKE
ncbi:MAG: DUF2079 domain-containing protein [candidate division Zixibacteria bacterium]|nr:DUF2079 domain-containing protein [candidate division Zixibacteria bacterium]